MSRATTPPTPPRCPEAASASRSSRSLRTRARRPPKSELVAMEEPPASPRNPVEGCGFAEPGVIDVYDQFKKRTHQLEFFMSCGEEAALLLTAITDYRKMFWNREHILHVSYYMSRLANILRANRMRVGQIRLVYAHCIVQGVRNGIRCVEQLCELETAYGYELWTYKFLNYRDLLYTLSSRSFRKLMQTNILMIYTRCFEAINACNWEYLAEIIASIDLSYYAKPRGIDKEKEAVFFSIRHNYEPVTAYLPESPENTMELIDYTRLMFQRLFQHRQKLWTNPSGFIVIHDLMFKVCHGFLEEAFALQEPPLLTLDPRCACHSSQKIFHIYKFLIEYELYRANMTFQQARNWLDTIFRFVEALEHKEHLLVLLLPLIELSVFVEERDEMFEVLKEVFEQAPALFPHAVRMLEAKGMGEGSMYGEHQRLAPFDVTPALLRRFSERPTDHGPLEDVVSSNLSTAFALLDLGRNRENEEAWTALYQSLKFVESQPQIIKGFWWGRKSWWPAFHRPEAPSPLKKDQEEVLQTDERCCFVISQLSHPTFCE
ncbi:hypothetical protein M3Y99_00178200 [Aphelenchoides fujianensis]|nr:hypothetical protein M3Y99_00178200 [Aphelenchoides fujianensis]